MFSSSVLLSTHQVALPGILGGLGPLAHIEFEQRLLQKSVKRGACYDQNHPVWLLINAAATPDRTRSLQGLTDDCTPWLLSYSQLLQQMGASFLVVTCNTAHAFYHRVQPELAIPWIHMMQAVAHFISSEKTNSKRIGIMATSGTLRAQLYSTYLSQVGLQPVFPSLDSAIQKGVMQSIYAPVWGIKSSGATVSPIALQILSKVMNWFKQQEVDLVIAGCTELSIGLSRLKDLTLDWVDPLDVMADLTVGAALGEFLLKGPEELSRPEPIAFYPARSALVSGV
ncbi:MAG: amino acid racemase [Phormidesmis sp.]